MKRLYTLLCLLVLTMSAFAQKGNPRLCQLDEYFKKQGHYGVVYAQHNGLSIYHSWRVIFQPGLVLFNEGMNNEAFRNRVIFKQDSVDAICQQLMPGVIDSVRNVVASVRKDASESYMYEYHRDGADTINYTLAFRSDDGSIREKVLFECRGGETIVEVPDSSPTFKFEYVPRTSAEYYHEYTEPRSISKDDLKQLDIAAVRALIEPALESVKQFKGGKIFPVYWQHDEGFNDAPGSNGNLEAWYWRAGNHAGLTTGTYYFLPAQYEQEAEALYQRVDSLALDYINHHPEQRYHYLYYSSKPNYYWLRNLLSSEELGHQDDVYNLVHYRDEEGLHILSLTTKGELWIPKEWTKIKRWVNDEKTYRKK